jgi:hypothetical protein
MDQKKAILALSILSIVLTLLSSIQGFLLLSRPRFEATKSTNPYIMFDTKTAQVCWTGPSDSGPTNNPIDNIFKKNSAAIPFCSDSK